MQENKEANHDLAKINKINKEANHVVKLIN